MPLREAGLKGLEQRGGELKSGDTPCGGPMGGLPCAFQSTVAVVLSSGPNICCRTYAAMEHICTRPSGTRQERIGEGSLGIYSVAAHPPHATPAPVFPTAATTTVALAIAHPPPLPFHCTSSLARTSPPPWPS